MLNYGFASYAIYDPGKLTASSVKVYGGKQEILNAVIPTEKLLVEKALLSSVSSRMEISPSLNAPVEKGQVIGKLIYESKNGLIKELPICSDRAVEKADKGFIFAELLKTLLGK